MFWVFCCLSTTSFIHRFVPDFECKIFLFEIFKMCLNNRNCNRGELEYYPQVWFKQSLKKIPPPKKSCYNLQKETSLIQTWQSWSSNFITRSLYNWWKDEISKNTSFSNIKNLRCLVLQNPQKHQTQMKGKYKVKDSVAYTKARISTVWIQDY